MSQFLPMEVSLKSQKGYAFVNFDTVEKAVALMDAFGGSCGDKDGPQLIVGDRAVRLSFARDFRPRNQRNNRPAKVWNDWVCQKCNTTNFARRVKCFGCSASKPEDATIVQASVVAESKPTEATKPTNSIVVRNMKLSTTEDTIHKTLSNFAPVKEVRLVRDRVTNESRGFAFVDFYTIEQAEHCIKSAVDVRVDGALVTLNFSKGDRRRITRHMSNEFTGNLSSSPQQQQQQQQQHSELDAATIEAYRKRKEEKMYSKFPLPFESAGTDYTFDPSTEQYYEPVHGFYFDPKTKYYYSAMEGVYYVYDNVSKTFSSAPVATPSEWQAVFDPSSQQYYYYNSVTQRTTWTCPSGFQNTTTTTCSSQPQPPMTAAPPPLTVSSSDNNNNNVSTFGLTKESKNLVAKKMRGPISKCKIAFFNEANKDEDEEKKTEEEIEALRLQAQRAQGQSRLHERRDRQVQVQETLKRQKELAQVKREKLDMLKRIQQEKEKLRKLVTSKQTTTTTTMKKKAVTKPSSKFICWICRRSFKSEEMLTKHELESDLHKKNVAAKKKQEESKYVDRAAQRRKLYVVFERGVLEYLFTYSEGSLVSLTQLSPFSLYRIPHSQ